ERKGKNVPAEVKAAAAKKFLEALSKTPRVLVQTPHPSEYLTEEAIQAESGLMNFITEKRDVLFIQRQRNNQYQEVLAEFNLLAKAYRDAIEPPAGKKSIHDEMRDSY